MSKRSKKVDIEEDDDIVQVYPEESNPPPEPQPTIEIQQPSLEDRLTNLEKSLNTMKTEVPQLIEQVITKYDQSVNARLSMIPSNGQPAQAGGNNMMNTALDIAGKILGNTQAADGNQVNALSNKIAFKMLAKLDRDIDTMLGIGGNHVTFTPQ